MASEADTAATPDEPDLSTLIGDLVGHAERLVGQQLDLLRSEVREELRRAGGAALSFGTGAGVLAAGGFLVPPMLAHLLHRHTKLPLWACYGLLAGALGAAGVGLLARARRQAAGLHLPALPETTAGLQENLTWLKDQATRRP